MGQTVLGKLGLTLAQVVSLCIFASLQHETYFIFGDCMLFEAGTLFTKFIQITWCGLDLAWLRPSWEGIYSLWIGLFVNIKAQMSSTNQQVWLSV